ncbi:uncharacterized protein LOC141617631 [Silene latifolia]|uniref:uncharacterized protein LOC141617631 n=1 Tax=Silene latifolia TaxID=37657 RepID=UPI003D7805F2
MSGLRQGDPFSPYLFVLSIEILSRFLRKLNFKPLVSLHPKCSKLHLAHLVFPDDLMIFTRGDVPSVKGVVELLDNFPSWSGLKANITKTEIYFGGVSNNVKDQILHDTGFVEGSFSFKYLGIPLNSAKNSLEVYGALLTKIQNCMLHWSNGFLSFTGRIPILNSVFFETDTTGSWARWNQTYAFPNSSIWHMSLKDHFSESMCSILKVKDEIVATTGSIDAGIAAVHSWCKGGKFQATNAYNWFETKGTEVYWYKALQGQAIIPSHRVITGFAAANTLPMVDKLITRGIAIVNRCVFCHCHAESHRGRKHWKHEWRKSCLAAAVYFLWKERNLRIFVGRESTVGEIVSQIKFVTKMKLLSCISVTRCPLSEARLLS